MQTKNILTGLGVLTAGGIGFYLWRASRPGKWEQTFTLRFTERPMTPVLVHYTKSGEGVYWEIVGDPGTAFQYIKAEHRSDNYANLPTAMRSAEETISVAARQWFDDGSLVGLDASKPRVIG